MRVPVVTGHAVLAVLLSLASLLLGAGSAGAAAGVPDGGAGAPDGTTGIVIEPERVEPGARDVTLVFRMTDGDPAAPTTGFQLLLPTGRPLVGVTAPAMPGWTADLTTTVLPTPAPSADRPVREIVSAVTWTATAPRAAGAVDFTLHVDLMPEGAGPVRFGAACTDATGKTIQFADSWAEGGPKPAHEALKLPLGEPRPLVAPDGHGHHHGGGSAAAQTDAPTPVGIAMTLAVLSAAIAGLIALLLTLSRRQRRHLDR